MTLHRKRLYFSKRRSGAEDYLLYYSCRNCKSKVKEVLCYSRGIWGDYQTGRFARLDTYT